MHFDRRGLMAGALASAAAGPAYAQRKVREAARLEPVFNQGPLASNQLAAQFEIPDPPLVWPANHRLNGLGRERTTLEAFRGKTLVVSLWAEWCPPCLMELPGFAALDRRIRTDKFQIVPILTNSRLYQRPEQAQPILQKLNAHTLPIYQDGGSDKLVRALTRGPGTRAGALPCNLLIDPEGRIRGRQIGGQNVKVDDQKYSLWTTNVALSFVEALAAGALA